MVENGVKCLARLEFAGTSGTAIRQKSINLRHGQVAHREMLNLQPADQVVEQLAMFPDCAGRVSLPLQILLEAVGKDRDRVLATSLFPRRST